MLSICDVSVIEHTPVDHPNTFNGDGFKNLVFPCLRNTSFTYVANL